MTSQKLNIAGTSYRAMRVWDGEHHNARFRFRDCQQLSRDRGFAHVCAQNAGGFRATRGLTLRRAESGRWHRLDIGRRGLARRFLVEIEPLVAGGIIQLEFDGKRIRIED